MVPRYSIDFTWRDFVRAVRAPRQAADAGEAALWHNLGFGGSRVKWTYDSRTALRLLLRAERIRPGEPVVVPRLTCEQVQHFTWHPLLRPIASLLTAARIQRVCAAIMHWRRTVPGKNHAGSPFGSTHVWQHDTR